jgi:hypothetical protein
MVHFPGVASRSRATKPQALNVFIAENIDDLCSKLFAKITYEAEQKIPSGRGRVCPSSRSFKALTHNGRFESVKYPPLMRSNNEQRDERRLNQAED